MTQSGVFVPNFKYVVDGRNITPKHISMTEGFVKL